MSVVVEAELTSLRGGRGRTPQAPTKDYRHLLPPALQLQMAWDGGGGLEHLRDIGLTRNISEY